MYAMSLTQLYMHVVPNLSPSTNILDIIGMLLILSTPSSNTTSLNMTDHECMNLLNNAHLYMTRQIHIFK